MTTPFLVPKSLLRLGAVAMLCTFGAVATSAAAGKVKQPPTKSSKAPAKPVEAPIAEAGPEQQQAAEQVFYGPYQCEFNQTVEIEKNPNHPAYVDVKAGKSSWLMKPVLSSTGAIRLEDVKGGALMVQIASKSMLLNTKTAQRIVDDCVNPKQRELMAVMAQAKAAAAAAGAAPENSLLSGPTASVVPAVASPASIAPAAE